MMSPDRHCWNITRSPDAQALQMRSGLHSAKVAVARKLAAILYLMCIDARLQPLHAGIVTLAFTSSFSFALTLF